MSSERPPGCPFDAYGHSDKTFLDNLTCENCPISSSMCEYKEKVMFDSICRELRNSQAPIRLVGRK